MRTSSPWWRTASAAWPTKYLNNYIVWHSFAGHARESFEEKLTILSRFLSVNICRSRCLEIPKRNPVPVLV